MAAFERTLNVQRIEMLIRTFWSCFVTNKNLKWIMTRRMLIANNKKKIRENFIFENYRIIHGHVKIDKCLVRLFQPFVQSVHTTKGNMDELRVPCATVWTRCHRNHNGVVACPFHFFAFYIFTLICLSANATSRSTSRKVDGDVMWWVLCTQHLLLVDNFDST